MVLELKDRLSQLDVAAATGESVSAAQGERLRADVLSALQNLGYHRPLAEKAVDSMLSSTSEPSFEQALKAALRELVR